MQPSGLTVRGPTLGLTLRCLAAGDDGSDSGIYEDAGVSEEEEVVEVEVDAGGGGAGAETGHQALSQQAPSPSASPLLLASRPTVTLSNSPPGSGVTASSCHRSGAAASSAPADGGDSGGGLAQVASSRSGAGRQDTAKGTSPRSTAVQESGMGMTDVAGSRGLCGMQQPAASGSGSVGGRGSTVWGRACGGDALSASTTTEKLSSIMQFLEESDRHSSLHSSCSLSHVPPVAAGPQHLLPTDQQPGQPLRQDQEQQQQQQQQQPPLPHPAAQPLEQEQPARAARRALRSPDQSRHQGLPSSMQPLSAHPLRASSAHSLPLPASAPHPQAAHHQAHSLPGHLPSPAQPGPQQAWMQAESRPLVQQQQHQQHQLEPGSSHSLRSSVRSCASAQPPSSTASHALQAGPAAAAGSLTAWSPPNSHTHAATAPAACGLLPGTAAGMPDTLARAAGAHASASTGGAVGPTTPRWARKRSLEWGARGAVEGNSTPAAAAAGSATMAQAEGLWSLQPQPQHQGGGSGWGACAPHHRPASPMRARSAGAARTRAAEVRGEVQGERWGWVGGTWCAGVGTCGPAAAVGDSRHASLSGNVEPHGICAKPATRGAGMSARACACLCAHECVCMCVNVHK